MTITVEFPPATLERLQAEAKASGKDVETFVREAVEQKLARRDRTFAEILKPIHDAVDASGINDHDLDELLEGELRATRAERRASRQGP
jgi:predicted DNA-binding protein